MRFSAIVLNAFATIVAVEGHGATLRKATRKLEEYNNYNQQQDANNYNQQEQQDNGYNYQNNQGQNAAYNDYGAQGGQQQQYYENFDEYMKAQMASQTFSFTGCSQILTQYATNTYVTYRLCDSCSNMNSNGCSNENGDYVVTMQEFSETYGEYMEETTGQEYSPFSCAKAEEFKENYYMYNQINYNQGQYQGYQSQYQYGQDLELFIGPKCKGGKTIEYGVFYNEECSYEVEGMSLEQALGFSPKETTFKPNKCIECSMYNQWNNNNGGQQEVELNPLCERLLEQSGRCDRDGQANTEFDKFWEDVIALVNGGEEEYGGYDTYDTYDQDYGQDNEQYNYDQNDYNDQAQENYYQEAQQQNYYQDNAEAQQQNYYQYNGNRQLQNNGNMNYYQYQNENTCNFIDSLPHAAGAWDRVKQVAADNGLETGHLIGIILAVIVGTVILVGLACAWCVDRASEDDDLETPYERDITPSKPSVTVT